MSKRCVLKAEKVSLSFARKWRNKGNLPKNFPFFFFLTWFLAGTILWASFAPKKTVWLNDKEGRVIQRWCRFFAVWFPNLPDTHLGGIVRRKTCIVGPLILCLERGIVFATGHRRERSDARWSCHLPLWKNSEGLSAQWKRGVKHRVFISSVPVRNRSSPHAKHLL